MSADHNDIRVTGSISDSMREWLCDDAEARDYLKEVFLTSVLATMVTAHEKAGISQMQARQPSIARMEHDEAGSFSLRRLVDYFLACDVLPLQIEVAPLSEMVKMLREDPLRPLTVDAYKAWLRQNAGTPPAS